MKKLLLSYALLLVAALSGCHTLPMVNTARTLEPGVILHTYRLSYEKDYSASHNSSEIRDANVALSVGLRGSIINGLELGFGVDLLNLMINGDSKIQFYSDTTSAFSADLNISLGLGVYGIGALLLYTRETGFIDITLMSGISRYGTPSGDTETQNGLNLGNASLIYVPGLAVYMEIGTVFRIPMKKEREGFDSVNFGIMYKREISIHKIDVFLPFISLSFIR